MTDFERRVLKEVLKIPVGELRTYSWIAREIGSPKSFRAVANTLRKNPYPIFIPCHRVIKNGGKIGGYSLGKHFKKELINLEKKIKNVLK